MAEYLLTGRDPEGRTVTERVDADSADEAVRKLRGLGYDDIVLHTDDVGALYSRQKDVDQHVSPREYVSFRRFRGFFDHVVFTAAKLYRSSWALYLCAAALIVVRRVLELPWDVQDGLAAALLAFPIPFALVSQLFSPARLYDQLIEAVAWYRWEEVLQRLPGVRGRIPAEEAAIREAQALAGLGRLEEGLEVVRPFGDGVRMPEWLYWARLSDVYFAAGRPEKCVEVMERAGELAPENPTVLIDLASALLRYHRDARRARPLLERARKHAISDLALPFLEAAEGIMALEDGNAAEARRRLEQAQASAAPFRGSNALMESFFDRTDAYLALACAALGETEAAERHYRRAEPRLRAMPTNDMLRRCRRSLGLQPEDG